MSRWICEYMFSLSPKLQEAEFLVPLLEEREEGAADLHFPILYIKRDQGWFQYQLCLSLYCQSQE